MKFEPAIDPLVGRCFYRLAATTGQLNFELYVHFSYVPSVDGFFGGLVIPENLTFNGMIGMIQRKVIKIIAIAC